MRNLTSRPYQVVVAKARELSRDMHECIFALLESNMRDMYEQVGVWDPDAKRAELQHRTSRFLLALDTNTKNTARRRSPRTGANTIQTQDLLGFIMWRYDVDETNDADICADPSDEIVEVTYWYVAAPDSSYEVQVNAAARGNKIGSTMLAILEHLTWKAGMRKVALTVFRSNNAACAFYRRCGYIVDATSPDFGQEDVDTHYIILCKPSPTIMENRSLRERAQDSV